MKILSRIRGRDVRHGNELQQVLRSRTDVGRINRIQHAIKLVLLAGLGIKNLYRASVVVSRRGKISAPFGKRRNSGEEIIGCAAARAVPSRKIKPFAAAIEN